MKTFLNAEWRKLIMVNYGVSPDLLRPFLPFKTELDIWNGTCYVSLVGFMFMNTKVKGFKIPWHINFEEVNLRFYVRHKYENEWRRGVVFIKELVPKSMISLVANTLYKEHYETVPMRHNWSTSIEKSSQTVDYQWKNKHWHSIKVEIDNQLINIGIGSEAEFITEHYWGYTKINDKKTSEYGVEHPRWQMYPVKNYDINVDFGEVYGEAFSFLNHEMPLSVFLAEGSEIIVKNGRFI